MGLGGECGYACHTVESFLGSFTVFVLIFCEPCAVFVEPALTTVTHHSVGYFTRAVSSSTGGRIFRHVDYVAGSQMASANTIESSLRKNNY